MNRILAKCLILMIRLYQTTLGLWLGGHCRFYPTCSEYGLTAVRTHGGIKGLVLITRRLLKCHPFHPGGFDPVPDTTTCQCEGHPN